MNREETQSFLKNPTEQLDLVVPRGGERLINFVKEHAKCAVLISGRGNNFLYIDENADWNKTLAVIIDAKTAKISACNALDKILVNKNIPNFENKLKELETVLKEKTVKILVDNEIQKVLKQASLITEEATWREEFLALKCCIGAVDHLDEAIRMINTHSGGHSATIMTTNDANADSFMQQVDCAAVYKNASTRFTDGGQLGVGAELAISTDKLHHRGPLGLKKLVTNKYYIFGEGQTRN
jgi:glutamate-5-semialdehyde dehydrogenase